MDVRGGSGLGMWGSSNRRRRGRVQFPHPSASAFLALLLLLGAASAARALDANMNLDDSVQHGQAGVNAFRQSTVSAGANGSQDLPLAGVVDLHLEGRVLREIFKSRTDSLVSSLDRLTTQATASVGYRARALRLGMDATRFEQKSSETGTPTLLREEFGSSADLQAWRLHLGLQGLLTDSRQRILGSPDARLREWSGSASARTSIFRLGDLAYRLSGLVDQNLNQDTRIDQLTHVISFNGTGHFAGGRGQVNLQTDTSFFTEKQTVSTGAGARLQRPVTGGVILDDTPLNFDPSEGKVTPVPGLDDGDRQTPTTIDIGDAASVVHQFGGDYRNLVFDFGQAASVDSAIVYVDRTLLSSALIRWRVFWSADPLESTWTELDASAFTATYTEWGNGIQGWQFLLRQKPSARYFKVVDEKLGTTVPDLFVTEFEVYTEQPASSRTEATRTNNERVGLALGYALSSAVHVGYDLNFRQYRNAGQTDALHDLGYGYSAGWNSGSWSLTGRYEAERLRGTKSQNTAVENQSATLQRSGSKSSSVDVSWSRNYDHSDGIRRLSNSLGFSANWSAAPLLQLHHRVSGSWLSDQLALEKSRALEFMTSAVGTPVPTLTFDLEVDDRRVSREAGVGFSRYDETGLTTNWRPLPHISWQGNVRYQTGPQADWISQNQVAWELLTAGTLKATVSATLYRDTLAAQTQRDAGLQLEWDARPNLKFRGNLDSLVILASNQRNAPQNVDLRVTWTL